MKSKLIGVLIGLMMLATILPITAIAATNNSEPTTDSAGLLDKTTVRGIVLFKRTSPGGRSIHFFAIRLHYSTISLSGERENGIIKFQPIEMPSSMTGYYGRMYIFASFRGELKL